MAEKHKMKPIRRIDLHTNQEPASSEPPRWSEELRVGLQETGFVRVVGHGVPSELIRDTLTSFESFFSLPPSDKKKCGGALGGQRGYTPFGLEHARNHSIGDQKEFFHVGQESIPQKALKGQYLKNQWPTEIPELKENVLALYAALEEVSIQLLVGLALAYDLPQHTFSEMILNGNSILRAAHYPPLSESIESGAMRAAPHEDINLITLLCGATDSGLEILTEENEWRTVHAVEGEIVVDVGDMLARMTNNNLPATTHRVVASDKERATSRYSLPFFAHPRPDCDLSVLETFIAAGDTPRFPPIDAAGFLKERLSEIGLLPES